MDWAIITPWMGCFLFNLFTDQTIPQSLLFIDQVNLARTLTKRRHLRYSCHRLQIQQEFGSFSNYCWRFLYKKPINNRFRYARQVPAKTPKSELISKDLMKRGFRCVGPTVIYSFMQISGMVNDHLLSCFRHAECISIAKKALKPVSKETKQETIDINDTKHSHE